MMAQSLHIDYLCLQVLLTDKRSLLNQGLLYHWFHIDVVLKSLAQVSFCQYFLVP